MIRNNNLLSTATFSSPEDPLYIPTSGTIPAAVTIEGSITVTTRPNGGPPNGALISNNLTVGPGPAQFNCLMNVQEAVTGGTPGDPQPIFLSHGFRGPTRVNATGLNFVLPAGAMMYSQPITAADQGSVIVFSTDFSGVGFGLIANILPDASWTAGTTFWLKNGGTYMFRLACNGTPAINPAFNNARVEPGEMYLAVINPGGGGGGLVCNFY